METPEQTDQTGPKPPTNNRDAESVAAATFEAKEQVFEMTRDLIAADTVIDAKREHFKKKIGEASKILRETVETTHNGTMKQKAAIYDAVVIAWQKKDETEAEKNSVLHPLLLSRDETRKRRVETVENINQLRIPGT